MGESPGVAVLEVMMKSVGKKRIGFVVTLLWVAGCGQGIEGEGSSVSSISEAAFGTSGMEYVTVSRQTVLHRWVSEDPLVNLEEKGSAVDVNVWTKFRLHDGDPLSFASNDLGYLPLRTSSRITFAVPEALCARELDSLALWDMRNYQVVGEVTYDLRDRNGNGIRDDGPCSIAVSLPARTRSAGAERARSFYLDDGQYCIAGKKDGEYSILCFEGGTF